MNHLTETIIEVCANSVESAMAAQAGGARRVELCDNLYEGGTTPSHGCILAARRRLEIDLYVIIRPRGGDFLYDELEYEIMREDVLRAKALGVDGVVFGLLTSDGAVDAERVRELTELARPLGATFHRAFDMTANPFDALEALIDCGVDRILTSGQRNAAPDGADLIAELVQRARGRIGVMAGGGVREENARALIERTGVREIHLSGRKRVESAMRYRNPDVSMGGLPGIPEYATDVTDAARVRAVLDAIGR